MEISQIQSGSWQKFENAIKEEKISNAYIIHGPSGSGKEALALHFVAQILSSKITDLVSSENITFIAPASKDFYQNLFKSKTFETDEYNQWKEFLSNKMYNPFLKKVLSDSNNIPVVTINNLKEKIYFKTSSRKIVVIFNSEALHFVAQILSSKITDLVSNENITFIAPASKDFYQNLFKSKTFETDEYNQWKEFLSNKMYNPFLKKVLSDSNNIPVVTINNLKEKIYFKTSSRKIVVIFNSEALSHGSGESANMLLKVLEEPPSNTTFILVTDYIDKVMPTIKSRCQSVYVPRLTNDSIAQLFTKNNQLSSNFISFITDNNLNALNSLNSFDKEEILDCIKDYFNAIRYKNAESISGFIDRIESLYKSSRNEFDFHLSVIRKFIKLVSMINQSVGYDIEFEEFEELALIINKKYKNMDHIKLIENIEKLISVLDGNANPRLSLMNMIINSNKALN